MHTTEVLIVGGGPAGSSCAWRLKQHGIDCLLLDREAFPRLKLCAGWITPQVVSDLELNIADYPHSFLTFETTVIHLYGMSFRLTAPQHSIRRIEFDDWLLKRSGAPMINHDVRTIKEVDGGYLIDNQYHGKYLIGAGGTRCPVYRTFFRQHNPRAKTLQVVALELEFPFHWRNGDCHLWFFEHRLPGYAWYVPKAEGYLNIGIGGMTTRLSDRGSDIKDHWSRFTEKLRKSRLIPTTELEPSGYSYYLRSEIDTPRLGNAFVIGDSSGLATRDMCEGIGPAIRSGLQAADTIATGTTFDLEPVSRTSLNHRLAARFLEYRFCRA